MTAIRELAAPARRDDQLEHALAAARRADLELDRRPAAAGGRRGVLEVGAGVGIEAGDQLLLQLIEERANLRRAAGVAQLVARIDVEDALEGRARGRLVVADESPPVRYSTLSETVCTSCEFGPTMIENWPGSTTYSMSIFQNAKCSGVISSETVFVFPRLQRDPLKSL